MNLITPRDAIEALKILPDAALQRKHELRDYSNVQARIESDDEADSSCPIHDSFHTSGIPKAIGDMTNFSPRYYHAI